MIPLSRRIGKEPRFKQRQVTEIGFEEVVEKVADQRDDPDYHVSDGIQELLDMSRRSEGEQSTLTHHVSEDGERYAKDETQPDLVELKDACHDVAIDRNKRDDIIQSGLHRTHISIMDHIIDTVNIEI